MTPLLIGSFLFGGILLEVITKMLPKGSHHHHHGPCKEHEHTKIDARRILTVDAFHNIHDGLTLVPAFLISPAVGFGTAIGILFHEIVQEISEFFILKEAGYSTTKALVWNFLTSGTILIGIALALTLANIDRFTLPLIAFAVGGFSYILIRDLFPSIISHARSEKRFVQYGASFLTGVLIMMSISFLVPEEDPYDEMQLPEGFGLALHQDSVHISETS
jgi:zinc and cadmium transporter